MRERESERETMMSAFPSGLVTWSLPGKQTGNRLHKGSLLGEAAAMASPFRFCSIFSEQVFLSEPREIVFLEPKEQDLRLNVICFFVINPRSLESVWF